MIDKKEYRVFIADDSESIVDALTLVLEDEGFHVDSTLMGQEVYAKTIKHKPDIILLDILMSGIDGRLICQRLKSDSITKNIPVILISAHPSVEHTIKQYGADEFIPKPFDTDKLIHTIMRHCQKQ